MNPKLEAGQELLEIAKSLLKVKDADQAADWVAKYVTWTSKWNNFLAEFSIVEGKKVYVHERLRKAKRSLNKLIKSRQMFTFIDLANEVGGTWDSTNNIIEGRVNAQLRRVLSNHRGLSAIKRIKAIFLVVLLRFRKRSVTCRNFTCYANRLRSRRFICSSVERKRPKWFRLKKL